MHLRNECLNILNSKVTLVSRFTVDGGFHLSLQGCSCLLEARGGEELLDHGLHVSVELLRDGELSADGLEDVRVLGSNMLKVDLLESANVGRGDLVEVATGTSVEDADLLLRGHGDVLLLLDDLDDLLTTVELLEGGSIEVRAELGEGSDLSVLSELELHGAGHLLHGLDLGSGTDTGHRETDVNGGADTLMEKIVLQEDLTISDRDDISGDIGGQITGLGLDDGESGEGAGTVRLVHLSRTLEETRVKIEDVTRVSLTTRRSSEKEGHLSVGDGLLGEIVIDDERVLAVVTEVLADSASGVGSEELKRSRVGGSGGNDDGVVHGLVLLEGTHDVGDGGSLLTDSGVDAVELLGNITLIEVLLLVDNGIDSDGSLASASIANDELTLASADGHEGVDALETGLHGLVDGLSGDDAGSLELNTLTVVAADGAEAIDGVTERVDDTAEHALTNGDIDDGAGSLDDIALLDLSIVTKDDNTNVVSLEVEGHTLGARGEFNHLTGLDLHETEDSRDTITDRDDRTELLEVTL